MKKGCPLVHTFIFFLYPILSLYGHNAEKMAFSEITRSAILAIVAAITLLLLFYFLSRDWAKASVIASAFPFLFFSHAYVLSAFTLLVHRVLGFQGTSVLAENNCISVYWLAAWSFLFVAIVFLILKSERDFGPVAKVLNLIALCLAVGTLANWGYTYARSTQVNRYVDAWRESVKLEGEDPLTEALGGERPDIYYIIVDGYARADILKELYEADNSGFLTYLREKGFYVAEESTANYAQTALSLASSLSYMYLDSVVDQIGEQSTNRLPLKAMMEDSRIARTLERYGYETISFATGYSLTELQGADRLVSPQGTINDFESTLIGTTPVPILLELPFLKTQYDIHREHVLYTLDHLADALEEEVPTLVIAHIIAPHPPFVFGANGEPIAPEGRLSMVGGFSLNDGSDFLSICGHQAYIEGYREQLHFVTSRLQELIDDILTRSPEPPVIILQADHGPALRLNWDSVENSYLPERMSILNAYFLPDRNYQDLYPSITPVNTFRVVLNDCFDAGLELLEDRSYFSSTGRPYQFTDVTEDLLPSEAR